MSSAERIFQRILRGRGLTAAGAKRFIHPSLEDELHDPLSLPDIKPALKRLQAAKDSGELVVVYGDYDIDGLCATALLLRVFKHLGIKAEAYIPDRFEQGYGLKRESLQALISRGAGLVVTVDCGTTAVEEVTWAAEHGLDIIITDHHEPGPKLPAAVAVVNPKRRGSRYPNRELAGCGVAFKLVQALQTVTGELQPGSERWLLDLVAFATVCDVVPLLDENRALAYFGLKLWPNTRWPGLKALSQTTGVRGSDVTATTLGFIFGPRLNAAGRIEHAALALNLLLADKADEALSMAQKLEELNSQRRAEQDKIERAVLKRLAEFTNEPVIILADAEWSHGVVGIVASRIMEQTGKPTYLLQIMEDGTAKGSARSFGGFSIAASLQAHQSLLISGGGHAAAGGLSLSAQDLGRFRRAIAKYHASLKLGDQTHLLKSKPDAELASLDGVDLKLAELINQLQPFGRGNPPPLLAVNGLMVLSNRPIGKQGQHARFMLADDQGASIEAVMFNPKNTPTAMDEIGVVAELNINDFAGRRQAELIIKDWTPIL